MNREMYFLELMIDSSRKEIFMLLLILLLFIVLLLLYTFFKKDSNQREEKEVIIDSEENKDLEDNAIDYEKIGNLFNINNKQEEVLGNVNNGIVDNNANDLELDLQSLSSELENQIPKTVNLTPYEEEQEEKAIISYDELVQRNNSSGMGYRDRYIDLDNGKVIQQVDLTKTKQIALDEIKKELRNLDNVVGFEHEDNFLKALKELEDQLR